MRSDGRKITEFHLYIAARPKLVSLTMIRITLKRTKTIKQPAGGLLEVRTV
jgi:hypothetical protein